jgi:hypothetical protein
VTASHIWNTVAFFRFFSELKERCQHCSDQRMERSWRGLAVVSRLFAVFDDGTSLAVALLFSSEPSCVQSTHARTQTMIPPDPSLYDLDKHWLHVVRPQQSQGWQPRKHTETIIASCQSQNSCTPVQNNSHTCGRCSIPNFLAQIVHVLAAPGADLVPVDTGFASTVTAVWTLFVREVGARTFAGGPNEP